MAGPTTQYSDSATFYVVRVPLYAAVAGQLVREFEWLPVLAPLLPLPIPEPVALGEPAYGYPWPWAIYRWLPGETVAGHRIASEIDDVIPVADFVAALHRLDIRDGPAVGPTNGFRGGPLRMRNAYTRGAIDRARSLVDATALTAEWEAALDTPEWDGEPAWLHGDLHPANLLSTRGRASAVIDWGQMAVGDPACDLMIGWNFWRSQREQFREVVAVDEATWQRGRGWALTQWIGGVNANESDNEARRVITRLLSEL